MFIRGVDKVQSMRFEYFRYPADIVGTKSAARRKRNGIEPEFRFIPGFGNNARAPVSSGSLEKKRTL